MVILLKEEEEEEEEEEFNFLSSFNPGSFSSRNPWESIYFL